MLRPYINLLRPQFRLLKAFGQPSIASHPLSQAGRMKVPLCSTGLRPLRGRCPASPSLQFIITQSRATGIADHILPLGDLFVPLPLSPSPPIPLSPSPSLPPSFSPSSSL